MRLSKTSYYSDFIVYPAVLVALTAAALMHASWAGAAEWLAVATAGFLFWTFAEYVLHRIALHRMPYFSRMHGEHHAAPLAFIGTPTWISVATLGLVIYVPARVWLGFNVADGLTAGVMFGYWWYGLVHHIIHHYRDETTTPYFNELRAWHMRHHFSPKGGNFGVTTHFWDHMFGTAIRRPGNITISS